MSIDQHEVEISTIRLTVMSQFSFAASARSAVGLVRSGNEDSALIDAQLVAVADGMGGHAGGEIASALAIQTLAKLSRFFVDSAAVGDCVQDLLLNSLYSIDLEIREGTLADPSLKGMGTTLTTLLIHNNMVSMLHVGDSRAYRLSGNTFELISIDHTVLQELLSNGVISAAEALEHPQRSMLTQALMGEGGLEPALQIFAGKLKDRYLVCSDGLSGVLSEREIKSLIKGKDRDEAVNALIDATYINGAPDNVTVVIADVVEESSSVLELIGAAQQ